MLKFMFPLKCQIWLENHSVFILEDKRSQRSESIPRLIEGNAEQKHNWAAQALGEKVEKVWKQGKCSIEEIYVILSSLQLPTVLKIYSVFYFYIFLIFKFCTWDI